MRRLPRFILVVACIYTKKYEDEIAILKEYFDGLPHMKKRCYGEYNKSTFYIIANTTGFHNIVNKLTVPIIHKVLGYRVYERMSANKIDVVYLKYPYASSCNSLSMPSTMHIPTEDIDNFIDITKVIKYG